MFGLGRCAGGGLFTQRADDSVGDAVHLALLPVVDFDAVAFLSFYSLFPRAVVDKELIYTKSSIGHSGPNRRFLLPRTRDGVQSQETNLASVCGRHCDLLVTIRKVRALPIA